MTRFCMLSVILVASLALAGCPALFDFNLLKGLEKPLVPSADDYQGSDGFDFNRLETDLSSPAFLEALEADPSVAEAIADMLRAEIVSPIGSPEEQRAAMLLCDLELKLTGGEQFVNNIVTIAIGGVEEGATLEDLIAQAIPAETAGDPVTFAKMMNALLDASAVYMDLAASIDDLNGNGIFDPGEDVPAGSNMGDVAQKAALCFAARVIVDTTLTTLQADTPAATEADAISQLYYLATSPEQAVSSLQTADAPNPFDETNVDLQTDLDTITKLFDCAGVSLP